MFKEEKILFDQYNPKNPKGNKTKKKTSCYA